MSQTPFHIKGLEYGNCNCAYGCPCQFNALPTHGDCRFCVAARIDEGHYDDTDLSGLKFVMFGFFPGAIHEGNGTQQLVIDGTANDAQREGIRRIVYNEDTDQMKTHWAVYNTMCTTVLDPLFAPIELEADMESRTAKLRVPGLITSDAGPIRNPVTGLEHRAQIVLPEGFEYTVAEMGSGTTEIQGAMPLQFSDSYAQFNELNINQDGVIR